MFTEFQNLVAFFDYFNSEEKCNEYLVNARFPDGVFCPHCAHTKVYNTVRKKRTGEVTKGFKCANPKCYKKFSVITGTYMEATKIDLRLWFGALYLYTSHKKSLSSVQIAKHLGVSQKTAWFMSQRIRGTFANEKPSALKGIVEVDETYVGGKSKNQGRSIKSKTPVLGMVEREGRVRIKVVEDTKTKTVVPIVESNVKAGAMIVTDEWAAYNPLSDLYFHERVKHSSNEFARGSWHTNTIEGFWSQLKRQIIGTHHWVSKRHLERYCVECAYKWNSRHFTDPDRFTFVLTHLQGRLKYEVLTGAKKF